MAGRLFLSIESDGAENLVLLNSLVGVLVYIEVFVSVRFRVSH